MGPSHPPQGPAWPAIAAQVSSGQPKAGRAVSHPLGEQMPG